MPRIEPQDQSLNALQGLHLWHAPLSSCSQRVRIVLAETGQDWQSHPINLEKDEHATPEYQSIHPMGLVPAFVDNGALFIESIDIIQHIAGAESALVSANISADAPELLRKADQAQSDLKLLTFEFLFRSNPPPSREEADAFQRNHRNEKLKAFMRDFAAGFDRDRLDQAVTRINAGFRHLDGLLADGREYLAGDEFSLADIAWMPNVHRFSLMGWPYDRTRHLASWFERVKGRSSYRSALLDWQNEHTAGAFATYTAKRCAEGRDIAAYGDLRG